VTAIALSHDHTYVASGHASGHIQLFDLKTPQTTARFVAPTSVAAVTSGRQEGHLLGSRIVSVGFVAGRHTAIISADEKGLAFYHSLGKVLFVDASDILRILGKYAEEDIINSAPSSPRPSTSPAQRSQNGFAPPLELPFRRRRRTRNGILGMAPLPLGTCPHPTDAYNIVALLTPAKLVIVGLKPSAKTWLKRAREEEEDSARSRSRWKGTLAWWPSVLPGASMSVLDSKKGATNGKNLSVPTTPMLVYSWGSTFYLLRVSEAKVKQTVRNARTGKLSEVEIGTIVFEDAGKWSLNNDVLAVQWLNTNVGSFSPVLGPLVRFTY
jgi:vacuolar protein sorting-associated protein 8